jgi:hypothetical protein
MKKEPEKENDTRISRTSTRYIRKNIIEACKQLMHSLAVFELGIVPNPHSQYGAEGLDHFLPTEESILREKTA